MKIRLFDKWKPIRTIWPYPEGWGVYNHKTHTVLETGLPSKERAQAICDLQNAKEKHDESHRQDRQRHPRSACDAE